MLDQAHAATNASEPESGTYRATAAVDEAEREVAAMPIGKRLAEAIDFQNDAMKRMARCIVRLADLISEKEPDGDMPRLHRLARDVRRARYEVETAQGVLRCLQQREGSLQAQGSHIEPEGAR